MSPNSIYLLYWQGYYELNIDTSGQSRLHCRYAISLRVCIILPIHGELPTLSQPMHMAVESLLVILYYYNIIIVNIDKAETSCDVYRQRQAVFADIPTLV